MRWGFTLLLVLGGLLMVAGGCTKEGYQKRQAPPGEAKADALNTMGDQSGTSAPKK